MSDITYHNKDVVSKVLTESLVGKDLSVYGIKNAKIVEILPTNLPAVEANELKIDNLLLFADSSIGIIDYESSYKIWNKIKYLNYIARILKRLWKDKQFRKKVKRNPKIRLIIIYTADVKKAEGTLDVGCLYMVTEQIFLSAMQGEEIYRNINERIENGKTLSDEELMLLVILPLTQKGNVAKQEMIKKSVQVAKSLESEEQRAVALAGILTFADKFIDKEFADYVKGEIMMTKVAKLIFDEGLETGLEKGEYKKQREIAEKLIGKMSIEEIADTTGLSIKEIKNLRKEQ